MKKRHPHKTNVLLVNITRLGDMLQATPTIAGMKMENPDCKVTVLVEKQFESVCHSIPNIDHVKSIDLGMTVRSLAREQEGIVDAYEYLSEMVDELRDQRFDYVLNMSSSAYTALLLRLIGIERRGGWSSDDEGHRVIESEWAQLFATSVFHQNRQYNSLNLVDVFRCSADVEKHPEHLLIDVEEEELRYVEGMIEEAGFVNDGPLVLIQAGASQGKRQWEPSKFIELIRYLTEIYNCRVVLTGTKKELSIIEPIYQGVDQTNVFVAAGRTNIPQLTAFLKRADILVTGDTGPMHISVAVGTPVISMFLASAYGFETGPYSAGNIVLQPVIECGPCNPNKPCARPDCHDTISPEMLAKLTHLRLQGEITSLPEELADERGVVIYRSCFDEHGFYDLRPLNRAGESDKLQSYRDAYRRLWLDDIGGLVLPDDRRSALSVHSPESLEGIAEVVELAKQGAEAIQRLQGLIKDTSAPAAALGETSDLLGEIDRNIEQIGYHYPYLGPVTRMFVFNKENISGSDAYDLASQMKEIYEKLDRRCQKFGAYYQG